MLLELLLEEEELSEATMHALQSTYNLQSQDAEVRPAHTHTHLYYSSIIFSNNIKGLLPVSIPQCSKFNCNSSSPLLSHYH